MIKLVYCLRKRDDIDSNSFYRYWLEDHAPKVAGVAESIGAIRYVQSHTCLPEMNAELESGRGTQTAYDGITETLAAGSSLKFGLLAAGEADVYPRFGPTME